MSTVKHRGAARDGAHRRPTILDVARLAGVHASTVSRVLNERTAHLVSPEVGGRVRRVARSLGYLADPVAAGLRAGRTRSAGVLVPDLANPVFPPILRGIEEKLARAGYTAIISNTDGDPRRATRAVEQFAARRVDGVILATVRRREPLIARCRALGLPVVLVNRRSEDGRSPAVLNDDAAGVDAAVAHLAVLGHRRIGHVAGPESISTGRTRRLAFIAALESRGLDPRAIESAGSYSVAAGAAAARTLLSRHRALTALVAANDLIALGCYDEIARRGLSCPLDLSVTGFNDMPFADRFHPPLTTVRIPHRCMGEEAARLLLEDIARHPQPSSSLRGGRAVLPPEAGPVLLLAPELVVRASTAPPRPR